MNYLISATKHFWVSRIDGYEGMDAKKRVAAQNKIIAEIDAKLSKGEAILSHRVYDTASGQYVDDLIVKPINL